MDNKIINDDVVIFTDDNTENHDEIRINGDSSYSDESTHGEHHHSSHHHHHSGHHHHTSHHHHHHSSNKKKKLKLNKKLKWGLVVSWLVLLIVFIVVFEITNSKKFKGNNSQSNEISSDFLLIEVANKDGVLVKDAVKKYLLTDLLNPYNSDIIPSGLSNQEGRLDEQVPVVLKLSTDDGTATSYKIELADNSNFNNAKISYVDNANAIYEFKHLYANTEYFYRVTVYANKGIASKTGSFKTADTPRILSVDGISNVRDIGNWRTDSGKRIKQGLLIRGTEMDGAVESVYHLTNEGLKDMIDVLGIKTDIDLRGQTTTTMDALGARVKHRYYNMLPYEKIFTDVGKEKVRMVFTELANADNYPVYLHCTYGSDRTGTVCYLLETLLGVSKGDCLKDYGLSNLDIANIQTVENGLKAYEGDTLKEKTESYLISCGVSEYQIESIRNIFLGD